LLISPRDEGSADFKEKWWSNLLGKAWGKAHQEFELKGKQGETGIETHPPI